MLKEAGVKKGKKKSIWGLWLTGKISWKQCSLMWTLNDEQDLK